MAAERLVNVFGTSVMVCSHLGPALDDARAVTDLVGEAIGQRAEVVVVPVERVPDLFFDPSSSLSHDVTTKFVTYSMRLAVVGDVTTRATGPAATWVEACNRGSELWFSPTFEEFSARLDRRSSARA